MPEQLAGARAGRGEAAQRVARGDHPGHRVDAVAGDVADHEQQLLVREQQRVVPVPRHQASLLGGPVADGYLDPGRLHRRLVLRHDGALQAERELLLLLGPLLAVGQLVLGRGERDLGVVVRRDVLERAAQRHHLVADQHRLGEDADLPDRGVALADDPEHRHGGLATVQQRLAEPLDRRPVRRDHEAVQAGRRDRERVQRVESEDGERRLGPPNVAGDQALLPGADATEALRVAEQLGALLGLADRPPGEDHAGEERRRMDLGDLDRVHVAGQGGRGGSGQVLGAAGGQDPLGHGEQAVAGSRRGVGLKQRQPGQLGGVASARVDVPRAQVDDTEIGHGARGVPQRPDDERGLGDLVERAEDRQGRRRRSHGAVGQAQAEHVGEPGDGGRRPARRGDVECAQWGRPPGLDHAEQDASAVAQAEHRAGRVPAPRRGGRHLVAGRRPGRPPLVAAVGDDLLLQAVELRRQPPPATGLGAVEPVVAEQLERAVGVEQPHRDRGHAQPGAQLLGEGGDELRAVLRPLRGRDGHQVIGRPGRLLRLGSLRVRRPGIRRRLVGEDGGGHLGFR